MFGLDHFTIITQSFYAYRAEFIAKKLNLYAAAYAPPSDELSIYTRTYWREVFARVKAVLDLYVLRTTPKFLGQPQSLNNPSPDLGTE